MQLFLISIVLLIILRTLYTNRSRLRKTSSHVKCKIVINSHVKYQNPLSVLFESLEKYEFREWGRIIVVLGGDSKESVDEENMFKHMITVIRTRDNAFDLHGLNQIYVHRNHRLVTAQCYFYMLDTSVVEDGFPKKLDYISLQKDDIYTTKLPNSNIALFDKGVIVKYGDSFKGNYTKKEALAFELKGGLLKFGNVRYLKNRKETGEEDIYKTGHKRKKFYYPDFEITKFILWGKNGDITGTLSEN